MLRELQGVAIGRGGVVCTSATTPPTATRKPGANFAPSVTTSSRPTIPRPFVPPIADMPLAGGFVRAQPRLQPPPPLCLCRGRPPASRQPKGGSSLGRQPLRELVARLASQIQQEPTCVLEGTIEGTLQPRLQLLDLGILFCLARLPLLLLPSALLGALTLGPVVSVASGWHQ